jgi:hypothetical protein
VCVEGEQTGAFPGTFLDAEQERPECPFQDFGKTNGGRWFGELFANLVGWDK